MGVLDTIALLLWIVIECYDEDMHIWCSRGLIGNFSKVTHDKHYWQSQLQVKTSSWLKLSLCRLLRVVITMVWCELIGTLRRKFLHSQFRSQCYHTRGWLMARLAWPPCHTSTGLIWSELEYDQPCVQPSARRIKHRLLNKRSHSQRAICHVCPKQ